MYKQKYKTVGLDCANGQQNSISDYASNLTFLKRERWRTHKHLQINTNSLGLNQTARNSCVDESSAAASSTWRNRVLDLCCLPTLPADRRLQPEAPAIQAPPDRYNTRQLPPVVSSPSCQSRTELHPPFGPQSSEAPKVTVLFKSRLRKKC